jgi:hypothetical protein
MNHLLSTGTPISPNIPRPLSLLSPQLADLLTRQTLIVPIIPLPNSLRNLDLSLSPDRLLVLGLPLLSPGQSFLAADLEEF